jgi:hypothetical protein
MKKWQKVIIAIVGFYIVFFAAAIVLSWSGNSGFEEQYKFNASKDVLIKAVENFKKNNREFIPIPKYDATDYLDTLTTQFVAYIYYSDKDMIVCFYINDSPDMHGVAYINLLSVNQGLHDPAYKAINKDFDRKENLEIKKEFQERFLNKLKIDYADEGNGNFVFWK